jgi:hypothetical protein
LGNKVNTRSTLDPGAAFLAVVCVMVGFANAGGDEEVVEYRFFEGCIA